MRLGDRLKTWWDLLKTTWKEFSADNGSLVSAAVSFYAFLSIFPLLLASIGILGMVYGPPERAQRLILSTTEGFAVGQQARDLITNVIHGSSSATGIGILLLLWSGTTVVVMLEQAMNVAWDVSEKRGFLKQRGIAFVFFLIAGALLLLTAGASSAVHYLQTTSPPILPDWAWVAASLGYLVPLAVVTGLFTLTYHLLPNTKVDWRAALTGGIFAGVLWEIALQLFTFYVVHFASYNKVYGSLGAVILLMVWIYYSTIIVLLGSELASVVQRTQHRRTAPDNPKQGPPAVDNK